MFCILETDVETDILINRLKFSFAFDIELLVNTGQDWRQSGVLRLIRRKLEK